MFAMTIELAWLPKHQEHVLATLAQADRHIQTVADLLYDHTKAGTLDLENVRVGDVIETRVTAIHPIPLAVSRSVADALGQLRSALEHTLYAEAEHRKGKRLTEDESQALEMPAARTADGFEKWLDNQRRPRRRLLGKDLTERVRILQPFGSTSPEEHPLTAIAEYTNFAKHRAPAIASTLLGTVIVETRRPIRLPNGPDRQLRPGDVLISGPVGAIVPVAIYPKISLFRPKSRTWAIVMHELGRLEEWVRTEALPILVTGQTDVEELPPTVDLMSGHGSRADLLATAQVRSAYVRNSRRMQVTALRESLPETLAYSDLLNLSEASKLVRSLGDDEVLACADDLEDIAASGDSRTLNDLVVRLQAQVAGDKTTATHHGSRSDA
jgi:hypothetical protein